MKRIPSMGLALLMLLSAVCIPVSASTPESHTYDHEGYIRPGDKFRPYDALTRAEMVCLLYRMLDDEQKTWSFVGYDCRFTDVPQYTWYYLELMNLDLLGIVKGYEDGTFRPDDPISRAEFVTLLSRVHVLEPGKTCFLMCQRPTGLTILSLLQGKWGGSMAMRTGRFGPISLSSGSRPLR